MSVAICPKGHASSDAEFCSDCGVRLGTGEPAAASVAGNSAATDEAYPASAYAGEICPDCGTPRDQGGTVFCEVCGFNFATGAHGQIAEPAAEAHALAHAAVGEDHPAVASAAARPAALRCSLRLLAEPVGDGGALQAEVEPKIVELQQGSHLIGRRDAVLGIAPEVELPWDDAVSRRHALLQRDAEGNWTVRDIGAANGTELNGAMLPPFQDRPLRDGDVLRLGRRSRIEVRIYGAD